MVELQSTGGAHTQLHKGLLILACFLVGKVDLHARVNQLCFDPINPIAFHDYAQPSRNETGQLLKSKLAH